MRIFAQDQACLCVARRQGMQKKITGGIYVIFRGANFKTSHFAQSLRQTQILILEILNVFLWLKFSPD